MLDRLRVLTKSRYLLDVMSVDNLDLEFAIEVSQPYNGTQRVGLTNSLETAIQFSSGESAISRTGSVVLTSICLRSPDGTAYSHTVPSSQPNIT